MTIPLLNPFICSIVILLLILKSLNNIFSVFSFLWFRLKFLQKKVKFTLSCILIFCAFSSPAQEDTKWMDQLWNPGVKIENWTTKEGLPQNSVNAIIKSSDGYLWIGTFGGICRFDGLKFEIIDHPKLAYQRVITMFESSDESIWIGTETDGLFNYKRGAVKHINTSNGLPGSGINSIFQYSDGTIGALVHNKGIVFYNNSTISYTEDTILSKSNLLQSAVVDHDDVLWISTSKGVFRQKQKGSKLEYVDGSKNKVHGRPIALSKSNRVYFANSSGIYLINKDSLTSIKLHNLNYALSDRSFVVLDDQEFWVGMHSRGISRVTPNGYYTISENNSLPKGSVASFYTEDGKEFWVGLNGGGLVRMSKNVVGTLNDVESILESEITLALHQDSQKNIWIGTNGKNLYRVEASTGLIAEISDKYGAPKESIWSISSDKKGNVWLATFGYGLFHANLLNNEKFKWVENWGAESHIIVATFYDEIQDRLLVGNNRGGVFQLKNGVWSNLIKEQVQQARITSIVPSPDGLIYMATQGEGVKVFEGDKVTQITTDDGLSSNSIRSIFFDKEENLWIGTYGSGISLRLNGQDDFFTLNKQHGLFDDLISTINEDAHGCLWISCNAGVFRVNRKKLIAVAKGELSSVISQIFNESHGMGDAETNGGFQSSSLKLDNGYLIYPTAKSVAVFNPSNLTADDVIDEVVIQRVIYGDTTFLPVNNQVILPSLIRDIEFEYTAPFFNAPELIKFEYQLIGYDDDWIKNESLRKTKYTRLAPGEYTFMVRAINSQGVKSSSTAAISLTVLPFWYELLWVQVTGVILFLVLIIFVVIRTQNQYLRRKVNEQKITLAEKQIGGLEKEVDKSKKELTTYTLEVIEKNNLLRELSKNLETVKNEQDIINIQRELNLGLKETSDWDEFKIRFEKVDADFIERLKSSYPELTKGQVRLASLLRLGFSSKQIADFLNHSSGSVDVARSKLRKRMNIPKEFDMVEFLSKI